jgi:CheY-like chemotaxis protein
MEAPPSQTHRILHILVLNDDPETLQLLASWFETQGHTTVLARIAAMLDPEESVAASAVTKDVADTSEDLHDLLDAVYRVTSAVSRP